MKTIYLDLDGVVANWTKPVCEKLGLPYPSNTVMRAFWLGDYAKQEVIDKIHYPTTFWVNLEEFPWAKHIINLVEIACPNWLFLTKACVSPYSFTGKAIWIKDHFPEHTKRLVICRDKKSFACKPGDILIDDHPDNVSDWNNAGGNAFHWPEMSDDCDYKEQLNKLKEFLINKGKK